MLFMFKIKIIFRTLNNVDIYILKISTVKCQLFDEPPCSFAKASAARGIRDPYSLSRLAGCGGVRPARLCHSGGGALAPVILDSAASITCWVFMFNQFNKFVKIQVFPINHVFMHFFVVFFVQVIKSNRWQDL